MGREYATFKDVLFNSYEEAERFCSLYEENCYIERPGMYMHKHTCGYLGDKAKDKYIVTVRWTNSKMKQAMENIGIKRKTYNGRMVYVYE